ncbi:MAG: VOC family protein [Candidatus Dormibacteraeota bacterium]|nr:VOC family protein [Candidatus Dormibacteraeota bacterium]
MSNTPFTICLWFDTEAEEAARYYTGIFKDSQMGSVAHYGDAGPRPAGMVMTTEFRLNGQPFLALNGGPNHPFTQAVSLYVECADQAEVDYYWERLGEGGAEVACGWLTDRYGFFWQIVPTRLMELMRSPDRELSTRVMAAMLQMTKVEIAALEAAADG